MLPRAASSGIGCGSLMAMVDACPEEKARNPPAHRGSCRDKLPWPCAKSPTLYVLQASQNGHKKGVMLALVMLVEFAIVKEPKLRATPTS